MANLTNLKDVEIYDIEEARSKGRQIGEGVYHIGKLDFADAPFEHFVIDLKDEFHEPDWIDTTVTVSITLGGGNNGRDHWGWPYEGFARDMRGTVSNTGLFNYLLESVGTSSLVGALFRYIRRGKHGISAKMWRM